MIQGGGKAFRGQQGKSLLVKLFFMPEKPSSSRSEKYRRTIAQEERAGSISPGAQKGFRVSLRNADIEIKKTKIS